MRTQPITDYSLINRGKPKLPSSTLLNNKAKLDDINALKLASAFEEFEKKFRTTMKTFIYMIKN